MSVKVRIDFVLTMTTLSLTFIFWLLAVNMDHIFWDIEVYQFAVDSVDAGKNPYIDRSGFDFMYHPIVLQFLTALSFIGPLNLILPSIYFIAGICLLATIKQSKLIPIPSGKSERLLLLALFFGYFGWSYLGFFSGNLSILGHLVIQIFGFQLILKKQNYSQIIFCLVVLAFSLIKPYFLAYLILFLSFSIFKTLIVGAITVVTFIVLWFMLAMKDFDQYLLFASNLGRGTFTNDDLGFSLFSSLESELEPWLALSLHSILIFFLLVLFLKNKYSLSIGSQAIWLITIAVLCNPRIKEYDATFLLLMSFLSYSVSSTTLKKAIFRTLVFTSFFGVISVFIILFVSDLGVTPIYFFASMILVWMIWYALKNLDFRVSIYRN